MRRFLRRFSIHVKRLMGECAAASWACGERDPCRTSSEGRFQQDGWVSPSRGRRSAGAAARRGGKDSIIVSQGVPGAGGVFAPPGLLDKPPGGPDAEQMPFGWIGNRAKAKSGCPFPDDRAAWPAAGWQRKLRTTREPRCLEFSRGSLRTRPGRAKARRPLPAGRRWSFPGGIGHTPMRTRRTGRRPPGPRPP